MHTNQVAIDIADEEDAKSSKGNEKAWRTLLTENFSWLYGAESFQSERGHIFMFKCCGKKKLGDSAESSFRWDSHLEMVSETEHVRTIF